MSEIDVILLNAPSCTGKTTLVKTIQELSPIPFLHVGLDHFEVMQPVKNGERTHVFYGDSLGGGDLVPVMHQCVASFVEHGAHVVAEHIFLKRSWLKNIVESLKPFTVLFVGLTCSIEELERREAKIRDNPQSKWQYGLLSPMFEQNVHDLVIDTTTKTPEETATDILELIDQDYRPEAFNRLLSSSFLDEPDQI